MELKTWRQMLLTITLKTVTCTTSYNTAKYITNRIFNYISYTTRINITYTTTCYTIHPTKDYASYTSPINTTSICNISHTTIYNTVNRTIYNNTTSFTTTCSTI